MPLPGGAGHAAMEMVLEQVICPAAQRFKPDLVLVSAGGCALFTKAGDVTERASHSTHLESSRMYFLVSAATDWDINT